MKTAVVWVLAVRSLMEESTRQRNMCVGRQECVTMPGEPGRDSRMAHACATLLMPTGQF